MSTVKWQTLQKGFSHLPHLLLPFKSFNVKSSFDAVKCVLIKLGTLFPYRRTKLNPVWWISHNINFDTEVWVPLLNSYSIKLVNWRTQRQLSPEKTHHQQAWGWFGLGRWGRSGWCVVSGVRATYPRHCSHLVVDWASVPLSVGNIPLHCSSRLLKAFLCPSLKKNKDTSM